MNWFVELLRQHGIAQTIIVYGLLIAIGITLGKIRVKGISLGVTWILFAGLVLAYFGVAVDKALMYFLRDFGLILFVYSIGLQVAPGFFPSLKKNALASNILAAAVVLLGVMFTVIFYFISQSQIAVMTGVMSGSVTNTPGLAAALAAINDLHLKNIDTSLVTLAYAVTYPFGVIGIILTLGTLQKMFGVKLEEQRELHRKLSVFTSSKPISRSVDFLPVLLLTLPHWHLR